MIVVVDACATVEILLNKDKARKFNQTLQKATLVMTPDLYVSELTNVFWKHYTEKIQTKEECIKLIKEGISFVDTFVSANEIWEQAFSEGINNKHSIYDMLYMVTALRNGGILITNDAKLAAVCKKNHVQVCF